jgi:glycosyl transferase family 25
MDTLINIIKNYNVKLINITNDKNSILNIKVKKVFVINLLEDVLKRNYIVTVMSKLKINYTLVIVNKVSENIYNTLSPKKHISKQELGCCLSHLYCLNDIIENKIEYAIIFEDDILFHKDFLNKFNKIDLSNCNFLLLGAHDFCLSSTNYKNINKNQLYHPDKNSTNLFGAHANFYSLKAAKCMFQIRTSFISFFDKEYMLLFNFFHDSSYICYPNLVITDVSQSHLNHSKDFFTAQELIYYKKCFLSFDFQDYNFIYLHLLDNIIYKKIDNYNKYITSCLQKTVFRLEPEKLELIKNRFTMDFFTLKDIETFFKV